MPKVISPFSGPSPIGTMLSQLGTQLYGGGKTSPLEQEKAYAAQRENVELDALGKLIAESGVQNLGADPVAQARLLASGYKPSQFADIGLMGSAVANGARAQDTQNWQVGSGQSYRNTAGAFDRDLAETARAHNLASSDRRYGVDQAVGEDRRQFNMLPKEAIGADGQPVFAPQGELAGGGYSPILSDTEAKGTLIGRLFGDLGSLPQAEQNYLGANSSSSTTPRNYVSPDGSNAITYDGRTNAQTGEALMPGGHMASVQGATGDAGLTNSVQTDVQSDLLAHENFNFLADEALKMTEDPSLFGPQGFVTSKAQELAQGAAGIGALFGDGAPGHEALLQAQQGARNRGISDLLPELYNPDLPKVEALWGILVYQGASALAGQEGRSVSDHDVKRFAQILGDPQSMFASAQSMRAKVNTAKEVVGGFNRNARNAMENGVGGGGAAPAPAPAEAPRTFVPPPENAIQMLRENPGTEAQFDEIFGPGAAQRALEGG